MKHTLSSILGHDVPLFLFTYARSLYHVTISLAPTPTERRLTIDIASVRPAFETREIADIILINGNINPVDGCTKVHWNGVLSKLVESNRLEIEPQAWLERNNGVAATVAARDVCADLPRGDCHTN
jgi:hypothetical protein